MKLKAYQVGETDIVAAHSPEEALKVFKDFLIDNDETQLDEVTEIDLATQVFDEERIARWTVGDHVALQTKPAYLFGWE